MTHDELLNVGGRTLDDPDDKLECLHSQMIDLLDWGMAMHRNPRLARVARRLTMTRLNDRLPLIVTAQVGMPRPHDWSDDDVRGLELAAFDQLVLGHLEWGHPDPSEPDLGVARWVLEMTTKSGLSHRSAHHTYELAREARHAMELEWNERGSATISKLCPKAGGKESGR